ncbi:malonyl-CoA:anthocyanidin 5-O-glucoside-6''-O-malonyltransferase-like [Pistacia vera]|uniref:malonyl-CoA:anthocyanidin 5-O-glucoside-6''-O-malonyltransferase-like n=1 Tax=Pistacia vera TaxID=55513 RepID=UPI001262F5D5|nr:malonyl-CoA:anthocyanidin 5-O-glucoside-6''-O-malonyltransferase-like [Pistacia vera]
MAPSDVVKIHETTKVTPPSTSPTKFSLPLTKYDTLWLNFCPVERLFFYHITHLTSHFFNSVILPNLKLSLSQTLLHYLPLAGNLIWPQDALKPYIYYSLNDGVSLSVAECNADSTRLFDNHIHEALELRPFIPELFSSDDKAAIISIQITLFPNEGFCIGISTHHAILDGRSSTMFIKSWAFLCKLRQEQEQQEEVSSLPPELTPCFDRTLIKDPNGVDMVYVKNWSDFAKSDSNPNSQSLKIMPSMGGKPSWVRATFELTHQDIKELRNKISSKNIENKSKQLRLSTFVLTYAYVFVCFMKTKRVKDDTSVIIAFTADYRTRLDPPIVTNYFGNCVMSHALVAKAREVKEENGVAFVAEKVSDMIKEMENGVLEGSEDTLTKFVRMRDEYPGAQGVGVAGSTQFDMYGSDFGWGRPEKVEIVSIDRTGAIGLTRSGDGSGGVVIGLVLEKQEMEDFASIFGDGLKNL